MIYTDEVTINHVIEVKTGAYLHKTETNIVKGDKEHAEGES